MNNRTPGLLIIDDRKEAGRSLQDLAGAYGVNALYSHPEIVYKSGKDVMTPTLEDLLKRFSGKVVVLIDPTFLSGIQDELELIGIPRAQVLLKNTELVVLSGNHEDEALEKIPEYSAVIRFFRENIGIALPWFVKPIGISHLGRIMNRNFEE